MKTHRSAKTTVDDEVLHVIVSSRWKSKQRVVKVTV